MPKKTLMLRILEFLKEYSGATIKDIATTLGISMSLARTIVYRLRNNGYIEKAGKGYILTDKGEWFVNKFGEPREGSVEEVSIEARSEEATYETILPKEQEVEAEIKAQEYKTIYPKTTEEPLTNLEERIRQIEKEIIRIEEQIAGLRQELNKIREELKELKKAKTRRTKEKKNEKEEKGLPKPIMYINEAINALGSMFNTLVYQGRIEVVGRLAVDKKYYDEFIKKFPLSIREAEKLPPHEKTLLEEMKRDARVILYAGKEYRLV